jgi:hypothetical protein
VEEVFEVPWMRSEFRRMGGLIRKSYNPKLCDEERNSINTKKALVIVAHPNKASLNHAIAMTCSRVLTDNGYEVIAHDLYEEHFDPVLPYDEFPTDVVLPVEIQRHCEEVSQADGIIVVHPNWWGQPPAILIRMGGSGNQTRSGL